jgi:hypothetical protein
LGWEKWKTAEGFFGQKKVIAPSRKALSVIDAELKLNTDFQELS